MVFSVGLHVACRTAKPAAFGIGRRHSWPVRFLARDLLRVQPRTGRDHAVGFFPSSLFRSSTFPFPSPRLSNSLFSDLHNSLRLTNPTPNPQRINVPPPLPPRRRQPRLTNHPPARRRAHQIRLARLVGPALSDAKEPRSGIYADV